MLHIIWYIIVGLIAGLVSKSILHVHLSLLWTIVLGIVGSVLAGLLSHTFFKPKAGAQFHPAGIIFSIIGALIVLFLVKKLNVHLPS